MDGHLSLRMLAAEGSGGAPMRQQRRGHRTNPRSVTSKIGVSAAMMLVLYICISGSHAAALPDRDPPATRCDTLTAFPFDPGRKAGGIDYAQIDVSRAVPECEAAILNYPKSGRLQFQLGRALEKANEIKRTLDAYQMAGALGHAGGLNNIGELYRDGKWLPRNIEFAFAYFAAAADQGYTESGFNLATLLLKHAPNSQMVEKARQLLTLAAQSGYPNALRLLRSIPAPSGDTNTSRHVLDLIGNYEAVIMVSERQRGGANVSIQPVNPLQQDDGMRVRFAEGLNSSAQTCHCHVVWYSPVEGANPLSGGHLLLDVAGTLHMGNKQKRLGANCLP
jgi:hypothetical protein